MLDLRTDETYNNKQVSKIFRQNFSWNWNMPKTDYFGPKNHQALGLRPQIPVYVQWLENVLYKTILRMNMSGLCRC